jgi:DNA-binding NtrC family response regulator
MREMSGAILIAYAGARGLTSAAAALSAYDVPVVGCPLHDTVDRLRTSKPAAILLEASLDDVNTAIAVARAVRATNRHVPLLLLAERGSECLAIAALRAGVSDYLAAPFSDADIVESLTRCGVAHTTRVGDPVVEPTNGLIGRVPAIRQLRQYVERLARTDTSVLITGETGTGKELIANLIHDGSRRSARRFVSINCAAVPDTLLESELFGYERGAFTGAAAAKPGLLEVAEGGTLFFDEIGDMGAYAQAKILRAIEAREIYRLGGHKRIPLDVRIVAATNQDLAGSTERGTFRRDLYFRLNVARIHLPPLRERSDDIPLLVDEFLNRMNRQHETTISRISDEAMQCLSGYAWPGNIRELRNVLECLYIGATSDVIECDDLPDWLPRARHARVEDECARLRDVLRDTQWNKSRAAEKLHWSRMTLYRKIAKYRLENEQPALVRR